MATRSEVAEYSAVIDGLSTVAFVQVKALLESLADPNPIVFRDALLATYPELMAPFMNAAADVAADWYSTLRGEAGIVRPFTPILAAPAPDAQLNAGVRYSLSPVFAPEKFIGSDVLSLLAGFTQKMIANSGRDTIIGSSTADPVRVGYARIPRAGCCAFCGLMASRGAVYRSAASAGQVQGRGVDASVTAGKAGGQGKGLKARGSQEVGKKFHDHCRCVVAPAFPGADNSYIAYTTKHFEDLYSQTGGIIDGRTDFKATLASWRQEHGTK